MGRITHDPERLQHGREVRTGEERKKKLFGAVGILNQCVINTGLIGVSPFLLGRAKPFYYK